MDPLSSSFRIYFLFLLIQNCYYLLFCLCKILKPLVSGVQIQLAHLMCFKRYFYVVNDLYEFVHAQQILSDFSFMQGNQNQIVYILFLIFGCLVGLPLENRHKFPHFLSCKSFHLQQNYQIQNDFVNSYYSKSLNTEKANYIVSKFQLLLRIKQLLKLQFEMQVSLTQNSLDEYLSIVKTFMLQIHQRIGQQYQVPSIQSHFLTVIDRASVKLQTQKQQIDILQQQLKEAELAKVNFKEAKNEYNHLQKRLNQKCDQIAILRQTVKTLYQDNQRISSDKEEINKEVSSLRESVSTLKKRLKKQEEEITTHRNQLKKITLATEEKIAEYLKEDQQKQLTIKKLTADVERLKTQTNKKEKAANTANRKLQQLKNIQQDYQKITKLVQSLKQENNLMALQIQHIKQRHLQQKSQWLKESDHLKRTIDNIKQKMQEETLQKKHAQSRVITAQEKNKAYENDILMRTEKLKEKSKQVKVYSEEINKLSARVQELSAISDQILNENKELSDKCHGLEQKLEELHAFQAYIGKLKGDINQKKSKQLGKLIQSLSKLHTHA